MAFKAHDYFVGEGGIIGYLPTEFGASQSIMEKKLVASGAILKGQVVELVDALKVKATTAASANVLGVAMNTVGDGEAVAIQTNGLFKLTASGPIVAPAQVESSTEGKVATKGGTVTKIIGIALTDASTDGDVYVKFSI